MQTDSVELTITVPASLADADAGERARALLVLDAVRSDRMTWRGAAAALGIAPDQLLELARVHGVPVVRYESADSQMTCQCSSSSNVGAALAHDCRRGYIAPASPRAHTSIDSIPPLVVGRVTIPQTVWGELVHAGTRPDVVAAIEAANWIRRRPRPRGSGSGLDPGETAAIILAEKVHADALLIDERRGRVVAAARGIAVIGTLGIVAGARRMGALERAAPVVAELRADGFWLSDALVAEFLRELGESP